jgi:hypothetical protein
MTVPCAFAAFYTFSNQNCRAGTENLGRTKLDLHALSPGWSPALLSLSSDADRIAVARPIVALRP